MTAAELLDRLNHVHSRGAGRWTALCPAHTDRSPSLSIAQGNRGILLWCFAGCSVEAVCRALGFRVSDLFHEAPFGDSCHKSLPSRPDRRRAALAFELHGIALQERAAAVLKAASGMDTSTWTDHDFDHAMAAIGKANNDLIYVEVLFDVTDSQRLKAYKEEHE
jgi:hypothetical protein